MRYATGTVNQSVVSPWATRLRRRLTKAVLRRAIPGHLAFLRATRPGSPIGLPYWLGVRRAVGIVSREDNPLFPPYEAFRGRVRVRDLKDLVAPDVLNRMTVDAQTIDLIWTLLTRDAPGMIMEFGSGVSTLVFARFASLMRAVDKECAVLCVDQSAEFKERTDEGLRRTGLAAVATVVHVPLDAESNYETRALVRALDSFVPRPVDFVFIDGPFGRFGCRVNTLPSLMPYARDGARWVLDDAFRDGELSILRRWSSVRAITVSGIYPVSKGLATGSVQRQSGHDQFLNFTVLAH